MTTNQLAYWRDQETRRSNMAKEHLENLKRSNELYGLIETERHNREQEKLGKSKEARENYYMFQNAIDSTLNRIYGGQNQTMNLAKSIMGVIPSSVMKAK